MTSRTPGSENQAIEVFFSYAHEDEELRDELAKHLKLLERQKVIAAWHDREIGAGTEWKHSIEQRLNSAQVILLLISADFLASDFCWGVELRRAMERHEAGEARVIPVILRPVDWRSAQFDKLQALPKNALPITTWSNQDEAFLDIARGIRQVVKELQEPEELEKPVSLSPKLGETQRSEETTSPSPSLRLDEEVREVEERASGIGVGLTKEYTALEELLTKKQWRAADEETAKQILEKGDKDKKGWLSLKDILEFPCEDLDQIDKLWIGASDGQFGFSVQKEIWEELGKGTDNKTEYKLREKLGWYQKEYSKIPVLEDGVDSSAAPKGHLPFRCLSEKKFGSKAENNFVSGILVFLVNLLQRCSMS